MKLSYVATAGLAATALAFGSMAATPASAHWHHHGGAVAAGVIGGLAAGALVGGAIASTYAPPPAYYYPPPPPVVVGPSVVYAPACHWEHERVWVNGVGWRWGRVNVCD
jgi:hypothetical protein